MRGEFNPESVIDAAKQFYQYQEPLRISTADRVWQIRKQALDDSHGRKRRLAMHVLRLSPAAAYDSASAILAYTDLGSILDFVEQAREYRRSFIQYLNDQGAFSSAQWFYYGTKDKEKRPDLSGVPVFHQRAESVASSLSRGATDILLLIILNVIFFILSHTLFMRREL